MPIRKNVTKKAGKENDWINLSSENKILPTISFSIGDLLMCLIYEYNFANIK